MATQQEIAKEYGMSFESVVRSYAADGHSMTYTAKLLDRSYPAFIRLCRRHGWDKLFVSGQQSVACKEARAERVGVCTERQREGLKRAMANNPRYVWVEYQGITDTVHGHARRLGLPITTVRNRLAAYPGDYDHAFSLVSHRKPPSHEARSALRKTIRAGYRR